LSSDPTLDREFFQKLLASAFAVQECGMKPQSLSAIVELQRSIRAGHLDVNGAMHLIAEWARSVANASGVAIGRLKGDQLVYTAGSGSAASYIGRRVMATFSTSANNEAASEILRVENTSTDGRIEAAICRQFGVKSLLILPIHRGRAVAGVLQVLFNEAHFFQNQEVRTYRIMAGLVGEAMSEVPLAQKSVASVQPSITEEVVDPFPAPVREPVNQLELVEAALAQAVCETRGASLVKAVASPDFELSQRSTPRFGWRTHHLPVYKRERITGLVAAAIIMVFTWILYTTRPATMSSARVPAPQTSGVTAQQSPAPSTNQPFANSAVPSTFPDQLPKYQAVRYLAPVAQRRPFEPESRVKHFGNDVTVRYFTPRSAVGRTAGGGEVRQVSEDVTVRYFKPKSVGLQPEPAGGQQALTR
jgi:hypothetical protein